MQKSIAMVASLLGVMLVDWGWPLEVAIGVIGGIPGAGKYVVKILSCKKPSEWVDQFKQWQQEQEVKREQRRGSNS